MIFSLATAAGYWLICDRNRAAPASNCDWYLTVKTSNWCVCNGPELGVRYLPSFGYLSYFGHPSNFCYPSSFVYMCNFGCPPGSWYPSDICVFRILCFVLGLFSDTRICESDTQKILYLHITIPIKTSHVVLISCFNACLLHQQCLYFTASIHTATLVVWFFMFVKNFNIKEIRHLLFETCCIILIATIGSRKSHKSDCSLKYILLQIYSGID